MLARAESVEFSESLDLFAIPLPLQEFVESLGYEWKLVSSDSREAPRRSGLGWRALTVDDLPPDLHPVVLSEFENPARNYGEIRRGDTRLVIRSSQVGEQWERMERQKALGALGQTSLAAVEEILESKRVQNAAPGSSVRPLFPGNHSHVMGANGKAASASASVRGDKALLNKLKAAAEE